MWNAWFCICQGRSSERQPPSALGQPLLLCPHNLGHTERDSDSMDEQGSIAMVLVNGFGLQSHAPQGHVLEGQD